MLRGTENIWITGARGQLGSALAYIMPTMQVRVLLTDREEVDIADMEAVRSYAETYRPDVIINCAGICDVEYCEDHSDLAYKVNAIGARNLSVAARSIHAKLVQISTDDIFDGKAEKPYNEFSVPMPETIYGKSKLAGEEFVKTLASRHLIIRSSWVYGRGVNYVTELIRKARAGEKIEASSEQFGSPTSAAELARTIFRLLEVDAYGIYHVACQGVCSRREFADRILRLAGSCAQIQTTAEYGQGGPVSPESIQNRRPVNAVLDNLMLRLENIPLPRHWVVALEEYMMDKG